MQKALGVFFLTLAFLFGPQVRAEVACRDLFNDQKNLSSVLEKSSYSRIFEDSDPESLTRNLSWLGKRKVRKLVQKIGQEKNEAVVEQAAGELAALLFGNKKTIDDILFKPRSVRETEEQVSLINEQLLRHGLIQFWYKQNQPAATSSWKTFRGNVSAFFRHPGTQVLLTPFLPPELIQLHLSDKILTRILLEGMSSDVLSQPEIQEFFKNSRRHNSYNVFRRLYRQVFFGLFVVSATFIGHTETQNSINESVDATIVLLKRDRNGFEQMAADAKQSIYEEALSQSLEVFAQKWGEPPTAEEKTLIELRLKKKLFK